MLSHDFIIQKVKLTDNIVIKQVQGLLSDCGLQPDIIDDCAVIYNETNQIIATISSYHNTIKCLAVTEQYQGNNLVNKLVTYMIQQIYHRGWNEIFIFAKATYLPIFKQLGFVTLYENKIFAFLTNRYDLFTSYLDYLREQRENFPKTSVIVMNANPFTKGHQYLVAQASKVSDFVYIIPVREETNLFSYQERLAMITAGVVHFNNVKVLAGSYYLVSKNVFPSYFLVSQQALIEQQTTLDAHIFGHYFAEALGVKMRFVGTEPSSPTTNQYNVMMAKVLPKYHIKLVVINRLTAKNEIISATLVRKYYLAKNLPQIMPLVPMTTLKYLETLITKK